MTDGLAAMTPAQRHRAIAADFTRYVDATSDWAVPTPVAEWAARDVVAHLVDWLPAFLAAGGVSMPASSEPALPPDPATTWRAHCAAVQSLLDGPAATTQFSHPQVGTFALADVIDRFYTTDVFMHTWDLARAAGCSPDLDRSFAAGVLVGLEEMDQILRDSGQYGPAVPVGADADDVTKLAAFIGRDPRWPDSADTASQPG